MTAQVIHLDPARRALSLTHRMARNVPCPVCHADVGRLCTNRGTKQSRLHGPHPDRIATAQAELETDDA